MSTNNHTSDYPDPADYSLTPADRLPIPLTPRAAQTATAEALASLGECGEPVRYLVRADELAYLEWAAGRYVSAATILDSYDPDLGTVSVDPLGIGDLTVEDGADRGHLPGLDTSTGLFRLVWCLS